MRVGYPDYNSGGISYTEVANYVALPIASSVSGSTYLVIATTGVIFINRKLAGLYKSNGITWDYLGDVTSYVNTVGGIAGQVLAKIDSTDFNTQWVNQSVGYDPLKYGQMLFEDFASIDPLSGNINLKDFGRVLISSGTILPFLLDENHMNTFGIAKITSSTTANSGVLLSSYVGDKVLRGGEAFKTSVRFVSVANDVVARFGFMANTDWSQSIIGKTISNGVYFDLVNGVLTGKISLNSVTVSTTGTFAPSTTAGQYYRLEISTEWNGVSNSGDIPANFFFATFKIYNGASLVFSETISKYYYSASYGLRLAGSAIISQSTGTVSKELIRLDYIQQYSTKEFVR